MSTVTLDEALRIVGKWLLPYQTEPFVVSDAFAMQVLRKLTIERVHVSFHPTEAGRAVLCALTPQYGSKIHGSAVADDPRDAIILAAGMWLSATRASRQSPVSVP